MLLFILQGRSLLFDLIGDMIAGHRSDTRCGEGFGDHLLLLH